MMNTAKARQKAAVLERSNGSMTNPAKPEESAGGAEAGLPAAFIAMCGLAYVGSLAATIYFCLSMSGGMKMPGGWTMSMMWMRMSGQTWLGAFGMFLVMWAAMMVAMMLPSAMPALSGRPASRDGVATGVAICGYFAVWMAFGIIVYVPGVLWADATMRSPGLSRLAPALMGAMLVAAGIIQFTRWKMGGLKHCRDPLGCGVTLADGGLWAAWRRGLRQGVACVICCFAPMLALLALGAMNMAAMLVVAIVISMEKLLPQPEWVVKISGVSAVGLGLLKIAPVFL